MELDKEKFLLEFGITPTEEKVYLEIARLGETKMGPVIKRTSLHRGTTYNAVCSLIEKGFLSSTNKDGKRMYKISGKNIFTSLLDTKEREIKNKHKEVEKLFEYLTSAQQNKAQQDVEVFYGNEAFKSLLMEVQEYCRITKETYLVMGKGGEIYRLIGEGFYAHTQEYKRKHKIKSRALINEKSKNHKYKKYLYANTRYMSSTSDSPGSIWIYGNSILMALFGTKPLITIKIQSDVLSNSFRDYFENMWNSSKQPLSTN